MNELIKITTNEKGDQLVSARELYEFLGIDEGKGHYSRWIKKQLELVDAEKNIDYSPLKAKTSNVGGRPTIEYILTIEIAKEICMIAGIAPNANEETKKLSKQARKYFIACEKEMKALAEKNYYLKLENYKLKLEQYEHENKFLQDKAKLSEGLLYAHNTINAEHGVGQSYMPQIIIDILKATKDNAILKEDDKFYYLNVENVKNEYVKYEIKPKRFKDLLEALGGCKTSIYITGRNKRNYRYECYAAPKYLVDCKL
ncbi:antA/AntB antirepressor family protein [Clostridium weizhouense]|uniref:AntA/AntB antirepressor family protein n=1 Tax=Clostridium weizhouense TaxID=2859781 RepID=A0ABS7ATH1_9CLOT|nr:antA/AntB antirepressor family protein [Clostridium weizhouense]MBW6411844.1 antA/AntB antirepressor family protein [Clostridium weizhouense]